MAISDLLQSKSLKETHKPRVSLIPKIQYSEIFPLLLLIFISMSKSYLKFLHLLQA